MFLIFSLKCNVTPMPSFLLALNKLNSESWFGKEAGTCRIKDFQQHNPVSSGDMAEFEIIVEHRPHGEITWDRGGFFYDAWTLRHIDVARDGTLLNGHGQVLPKGNDPVFLDWEVFETIDFNKCNFGELISEA